MNLKTEILKIWLPLFAVLFLFGGCYQDDTQYIVTGASGDFLAFFEDLPSKTQTVEFDVDQGVEFDTELNSIITIPPNAFIDENQNELTGENIQFEYIEIKKKGDLVLFNKPTISNGRLLESGGVFSFEAKDLTGAQSYQLKEDAKIAVRSSAIATRNDMLLFYGEEDGTSFNWQDAELVDGGLPIGDWVITDIGAEVSGYDFEIDSLTWINCDRFNDVPDDEKSTACIELPEIYTNENTIAFVVFSNINSVVALPGNASLEKFCEPNNLLPIGSNVDFITITSLNNGIYYFGMKNAVLTSNHEEFISPERKSLEEILEIINNL